MGWNTGSEIFDKIMQVMNDHIEDADVREAIYTELIPIFEGNDIDSLSYLLETDDAFDKAYKYVNDERNTKDDVIMGVWDDDD